MTIEKLIEVLTRFDAPQANVFLGISDEQGDRVDVPIQGVRLRMDGEGTPIYVVLEDE